MRNRNGFTLIELFVVIIIISILLAFLMPARSEFKVSAQRVLCGTRLKGLGTAMAVYMNDYDDKYPQLPGNGVWSKVLGFDYDLKEPNFNGAQSDTPRTITSSWYLLVRQADVAPQAYVCPISNQIEFDAQNAKNLDIVELWDFSPNPYKHVSYAYHNPYGKFSADNSRPADFAVAADMNPWFKNGNNISPTEEKTLPPQIIDIDDATTFIKSNSLNHIEEYEEDFLYFFKRTQRKDFGHGQNVLYADGHTSYEKQPNVGVKNDNIYTFWSTEENPTEQDKQGGTAPTSRSAENDAKSKDDSFLAI